MGSTSARLTTDNPIITFPYRRWSNFQALWLLY